MEINLVLAWFDFWVGFFWDRKKRDLYILPIPTIGIRIHFHKWKNKQILKMSDHTYDHMIKYNCDCDDVLYKKIKSKISKWKDN